MSGIILPEWVKQNAIRAEFTYKREEWAHFDRLLKDLDPNLSLVYADTRTPPAPSIVPGYFHIKRVNEGTSDSYLPLTGPNGEYIEPSEKMLQTLRENNLWNRDVFKKKLDALAKEEERQKNPRGEFEEEMRSELAYHVKGNTNPGIPVKSDIEWSPKAKARKKTRA